MPFVNRFHCFPEFEGGLIFYVDSWAAPVPLMSVDVTTRIVDFIAEVIAEQTYVNCESRSVTMALVSQAGVQCPRSARNNRSLTN